MHWVITEQYLWVHRRWKSRPKWEREGNPMPERVQKKLASLPWLSPQELDRLVHPQPQKLETS